eukprot:1157303-Pelagomonas_calceolata.AAC.10
MQALLPLALQKVVDFQWCPTVPWAIMSVSDDGADEESGGGSLQVSSRAAKEWGTCRAREVRLVGSAVSDFVGGGSLQGKRCTGGRAKDVFEACCWARGTFEACGRARDTVEARCRARDVFEAC